MSALSHAADLVKSAGREGDTELVHMAPVELELLRHTWGEPTINPVTGLPEYFSFKNLLKYIAPAAISAFFPGAGSAIGEALGASGNVASILGSSLLGGGVGALTGGGKGALTGALTGGAGAALFPLLGNALSGTSVGNMIGAHPSESLSSDPTSRFSMAGAQGNSDSDFASRIQEAISPKGLAAVAPPETSWWDKAKLPLALGAGALALGGMGDKQAGGAPTQTTATNMNRTIPQTVHFDRTRREEPTTAAPYYTFGTVPFSFYDNNSVSAENTPGYAAGGQTPPLGGDVSTSPKYIRGAKGSGRADNIPANLSNNEYVMDAETVSLLGDGSPDHGANKLDMLRKNLRQHKGKILAKGKFSPPAKSPLSYMQGKK